MTHKEDMGETLRQIKLAKAELKNKKEKEKVIQEKMTENLKKIEVFFLSEMPVIKELGCTIMEAKDKEYQMIGELHQTIGVELILNDFMIKITEYGVSYYYEIKSSCPIPRPWPASIHWNPFVQMPHKLAIQFLENWDEIKHMFSNQMKKIANSELKKTQEAISEEIKLQDTINDFLI